MFSESYKRVHEVLVFDEADHRSWFIGSSVLSGNCLRPLSDIVFVLTLTELLTVK